MEGKVKFFNQSKGFGFIIGNDDKDYFVHKTALTEGTVLDEGTEVVFDPKKGERGRFAESVSLKED